MTGMKRGCPRFAHLPCRYCPAGTEQVDPDGGAGMKTERRLRIAALSPCPPDLSTGHALETTYHLHLVSDATDETINSVTRACLVQFEAVEPVEHSWTLI